MNDTRYCYSAGCTWHGPIQDVGKTDQDTEVEGLINGRRTVRAVMPNLPCCPYCESMLFEMDNEKEFWDGAKKYQKEGATNYVVFIEWTREQKRCWPSYDLAVKAFFEATGKTAKIHLDS